MATDRLTRDNYRPTSRAARMLWAYRRHLVAILFFGVVGGLAVALIFKAQAPLVAFVTLTPLLWRSGSLSTSRSC